MLAVIIVNYRTPELTIRCIESVIEHADIPLTIFVVENGSNDNSWSIFNDWRAPAGWMLEIAYEKQRYHSISSRQVTFLQSSVNRGFAGGNNLALSITTQTEAIRNVWLLNSDTELCGIPIGVYTNSLEALSGHVGMLGCVVRYFDEPRAVQGIGGVINRYTGCSKLIKKTPYKGELDFAFGASILVRKEFIIDVGLMCEDYFLYYEEADWAERGRVCGYTINYTDNYTVLHKAGRSIGTTGTSSLRNWTSDYYGFRNRYMYVRNFYPEYTGIALLGILAACVNRLIRSEYRRAWAILRVAINIKAVVDQKNVIVKL